MALGRGWRSSFSKLFPTAKGHSWSEDSSDPPSPVSTAAPDDDDTESIVSLSSTSWVENAAPDLDAWLHPDAHDSPCEDADECVREEGSERMSNERLWNAVQSGNLLLLRQVLFYESSSASADVEASLPDGSTALHIAAHLNHLEVVAELLQIGADADASTQLSLTPLHVACQQGHLEVVKLLGDHGCTMTMKTSDGDNALHLAAARGHVALVKFLLECAIELLWMPNNMGQHPADVSLNAETLSVFQQTHESGSSPRDCYARRTPVRGSSVVLRNSRRDAVRKFLDLSQTQKSSAAAAPSDIWSGALSSRRSQERDSFVKLRRGTPRNKHASVESFHVRSRVGKGTFADVFQVTHKRQGTLYALKVQNKPQTAKKLRYAQSEREILSFASHPFIVHLEYAFQTSSRLMLVLEYCSGGDLSQLIRRHKGLPECIARLFTAEAFLALEYLHERDIVYRDMKPANVIIDGEGHVRLSDFGLAKQGVGMFSGARSFCGSVSYLSPEVLRQSGYGRAIDLYGLGVVLHEMLTGKIPFYHSDREIFYRNIARSGALELPWYVSPAASSLIRGLMERDPEQRLGTLEGIRALHEHEFFSGVDFDSVLLKEEASPAVGYLSASVEEPPPMHTFGKKERPSKRWIDDWEYSAIGAPSAYEPLSFA